MQIYNERNKTLSLHRKIYLMQYCIDLFIVFLLTVILFNESKRCSIHCFEDYYASYSLKIRAHKIFRQSNFTFYFLVLID